MSEPFRLTMYEPGADRSRPYQFAYTDRVHRYADGSLAWHPCSSVQLAKYLEANCTHPDEDRRQIEAGATLVREPYRGGATIAFRRRPDPVTVRDNASQGDLFAGGRP